MKPLSIRWRLAQFFELWWWKLYLIRKDENNYLRWKRNYWKKVFDLVGEDYAPKLNQRVIELGCGPAGCFIFFTQHSLTAIDPLIDEYEQNIPFFRKSNYPHTVFVSADIENLSLDKQFDVVLCFNVINHVSNIGQCLQNIKKLLSPKGILLLSVDAHRRKWLKNSFSVIPFDILHPQQFTLPEYLGLLKAQGLSCKKEITLHTGIIFSHYLLVLSSEV
jgi:2-polyprenyl-6-hydroxyphenyl methylase/3-demethylubiquinone-9 3-methyltransferase